MMPSTKWKAYEWVGKSRQGRSGRLPMNSWGGCMKLWSPNFTRTIGMLMRTYARLRRAKPDFSQLIKLTANLTIFK